MIFFSLLTIKITFKVVLIWKYKSLCIRVKKRNQQKTPKLQTVFSSPQSFSGDFQYSISYYHVMSLCNTHQILTYLVIHSTAWLQMKLLPVQLLSYGTVYLCLCSLFFLAHLSLWSKKVHLVILFNFSLPQFLYYLLFRSVTVLFNSMKCL